MTATIKPTLTFNRAIDLYFADLTAYGRINSGRTEENYRRALHRHSDDVANRHPATTDRNDVKKTLRHWTHPNTQRCMHSVLASFYGWAMEEGLRIDNPADQVRRARARKPDIFRPTREEVIRLLDASMADRRDRWAIHLGVLAGCRNQELRGLQLRHFERPGVVWVSPDIAKGGRERWVPVLPELESVVVEILGTLGPTVWDRASKSWVGDHVVYARRHGSPFVAPGNRDVLSRPAAEVSLVRLVKMVGVRAAISADISPHTLRHAFGDHIARYAGLRAAQEMLGHANVATTEGTYTGRVTIDELAASVEGFRFRVPPAGQPDVEEE